MRAAFFTLGCKVNQYESYVMADQFSADGFDIVKPEEPAEVYVINSCTVTATGDKKTRQILRRFRNQAPSSVIALTGCFPQAFPDAASRLPEADIITGSRGRAQLLQAVRDRLAGGARTISIEPHRAGEGFEPMEARSLSGRTRAFVKIQDGCQRYCAFCIIPKARGPVRSKRPEDLRHELAGLAEAGYWEIVLAGINLSCYGQDLGLRLIDAVELACSVEGIDRVRLGSLEPELLTGEDIRRMAAQPKLCPQFHLSLQSGCDATLKRMNRHYDTAEYMRIAGDLRRHFQNTAVTTDIMAGFPGETEEEFQASLRFMEKASFAKVHVFAYSRRPGTAADKMENQVPQETKRRRAGEMLTLAGRLHLQFLESQTGLIQPVLFENQDSEGLWQGYTPSYTPVSVKSDTSLHGRLLDVRITGVIKDRCAGVLL